MKTAGVVVGRRVACPQLFGVFLFACGLVAADAEISLSGVWVLDGVTQDGVEIRDPRWTCLMTFEGASVFSIASTAMIEKQVEGSNGASTQMVQNDVRLVGTYRMDGDQLVVTLSQSAMPDQREFIMANFGVLDEPQTFRVGIAWEGQLVLTNETKGRRLRFVRHTKSDRS